MNLDLLALIITPAISALIGALVAGGYGRVKRAGGAVLDRDRALADGMRVLLRKQLVDAYDRYVHQHARMTVERRSEIDETYRVYHALGGNGTVTAMYKELQELDIWIERG